MKVSVEELSGCKRALSVEVSPEAVRPTMEGVFQKLGQRVSLPGFRRGKVPREVLERRFRDEIREEVLQEMISTTYRQALEQFHLDPVGLPTVEEVVFQLGETLRYRAVVEVKPPLEVKDYTGVAVSRRKVEVTDEEVEEHLKLLQEQAAEYVPMEGWPALGGDRLIVDAQGFLDGKPRKDLQVEDFSLELGAGQLLPGVDERLAGVQKGEVRDVPVTFPPEDSRKDLRNREIVFRFTVKEIKKKKVLPLDDAFARAVGEGETLRELRDKVRQEILKRKEEVEEQRLRWEVVEKVAAVHPFEVPEGLVRREMEGMLREFSTSVGAPPERLEGDVSFRLKLEESARKRVKHALILEAITRQEGIAVDSEEVEAEVQRVASALNRKPDELMAHLNRESRIEGLRANLVERKTIDFLFAQARILDNFDLITLP
ncbi:MAG: trigger factor [candidate division NC10 bacterium]|jgi:trigger factor|nr:trigger factor [candidate division NC10 bacterium]MCZ6550078.1 trigger factor [candidate division NC10 bacterium]